LNSESLRPHPLRPSFRFLLSLLPLRTATATTVFYCYRWLQPLSITATLHSCRSRPPPLSVDTGRFRPLFSAVAAFYQRRFLPPPFSTAAVFYRRRFPSAPLPIDAAFYRRRFLSTPLSTAPAHNHRNHNRYDRNCHNRPDRDCHNRNRNRYNRCDRNFRNRYDWDCHNRNCSNLYFNHRRNRFYRFSYDNRRS
jgi:hypothetical protein